MKWIWWAVSVALAACDGSPSDIGDPCFCLVERDAGLDGSVEPRLDAQLAEPVDSAVPFSADCAVILSLDSEGQTTRSVSRALDAGTTPLSLWAENRTAVPQSLAIDACRGGPSLEGLGAYEPNGRCVQGACAPNLPPRVLTLAPGERVSLGTPQLEVRATACNVNPLAAGDYQLSFALNAPQTSAVCGPRPLTLQVR